MKWILVAIAFAGDVPTVSRIFPGGETQATCIERRDDLLAEAKKAEADIWAECVEVRRKETKPQGGGHPSRRSPLEQ